MTHERSPLSRLRLAALCGAAVAAFVACDSGGSVPPADPSCGRDAIIEDAENGTAKTAASPVPATLHVTYQGCADIGVCYPPTFSVPASTRPAMRRPRKTS